MLTLPIYIDVENKINNFIKDSIVETECDKSRVHKLLKSCLETTEFNKYTIIDEDTTTIDYFDKKYVLSFVTKNYENNRFTENKIIIDKAKNKPLFRLSYTYDNNNNHAKDISYYEVSYTTYIKDTSKIEDKLILRELSFDIRDSVVLDLFGGTGNLGFEALSNGASFCYFNDKNRRCTLYIEKIIDELNIKENTKVFNLDYNKALNYFTENKIKFDLVFLDPPYKMENLNEVVKTIYENELLNKNGLIICEVDTLYLDINYLSKIKEKKYGNKYIIIYKNNL